MGQTPAMADDDLRSVSMAYVALPEDKRREFRAEVRAAAIDPAQLPIVRFPDRTSRFPLSHAQERLWFLWRLDPSSAAYNIPGAVRLSGKLDTASIRQALTRISLRHESLRKRFEEVDGVAWQIVGDVEYGWREYDLSDQAPDARERELARRLVALSREPFDLYQGPLLRVTLLQLAPDEHVLHFCIHHIVSDGWSMDLLHKEFVEAYGASTENAGPDVRRDTQPEAGQQGNNPLSIQYGDYARWQREWLDDGFLARQLDYWIDRLGHEHPVLELPYTRRRTGLRSAEGGGVSQILDGEITSRLKQVARRHDTTLFVVLLSAYMALLAKYSGQQDIRVGIPVAGRDRLETEPLIGFFVNTLVIRSELREGERYSDLLGQVRTRVLEAHQHQDLPFAQLVEALQPARSFSQTPLFQTMFNFGVADRKRLSLPDLAVSGLLIDLNSSRFDLVLNAFEGTELSVAFNFSRDVFDEPVVKRMLDHYVELLGQIAAAGEDVPLGLLQLSAADAAHPARADYPFEIITARIDRQAREQPRAPAVRCEGESLTYGQLNDWANRIAHRLSGAGSMAERRIGLFVERSAAVVAGLLGILKSGAAFVPLDPDYPPDRLSYMMDDAQVSHVLTDARTAQRLSGVLAGRDFTVVTEVDGEPSISPEIHVQPDQLAYVIYTSGSTGLPKGVAISHRALSLHMNDFIATYGITSKDKQFQSSTINFDVALHEMLPALMQGGQVEMRGNRLWSLEETSRCLTEQQVTFSRIPTAYWQQWLRDPPTAQALSALRQITVGGEGLPGDALRRWRESGLAHIRLDNLYGPTETTVACMYLHTGEADAGQAIVSIGQPYPSRSVYVLDAEGNEAPTGGLGELCIGGDTLARGYLDRPALTAEKFIPDPWREDGGRLYRTGDLCRRRDDGVIDFLGRMDQQIKLRGFRIELGEVEAALRQAPGVGEAVVELRGEGDGKRLVAYVTGSADESELRETIAGRLPSYMVPSAYVFIEKLPLLPSGKVDRKSLPEPAEGRRHEAVAPRSRNETVLLAIWCEVLRRTDLGVTDNFFEQGGDSILSLQIVARARQAGLVLAPRQVFEHPTVAELARLARDAGETAQYGEGGQAGQTAHGQTQSPQAVADFPLSRLTQRDLEGLELDLSDVEDIYPATPVQQGMLFHSLLQAGQGVYVNQKRLTLQGRLDREKLRLAWETVVSRHTVLRTHFELGHGGDALQVVHRSVSLPYEERDWADLGQDDYEAKLQSWLHADVARGFEVGRAPLLRLALFTRPDGQHDLVWTIHHLLLDGWSMSRVSGEVLQAYAGIPLDAPVCPYRDYMAWLAARDAEAGQAYWKTQIRRLLSATLLADAVSTPVPGKGYGEHTHALGKELTQQVMRFARNVQVTINTVLQAAWSLLLSSYTGQYTVAFGATVSGRPGDLAGIEQAVGLYINTVPVVIDVQSAESVGAWMRRVQTQALDSQEHEYTPLYEIQRWAGMSGHGLFDTLVVYENYPESEALRQAGKTELAITSIRSRGETNYPLTLLAIEDRAGLFLSVVNARQEFDERTADLILEQLRNILAALVRSPETRVGEVVAWDDAERRRLLALSRHDEAYSAAGPVHRQIEAKAGQQPDAIALIYGDQALRYAELNAKANRLAHYLVTQGVGPEVKVGVAQERSVDLVVSLLAVMKAGGAYVPLDPSYPAERLSYMMADSGLSLVLTQSSLRESLPVLEGVTVLEVDGLDLSGEPETNLSVPVHGENLAYVIYTSGSTGRPKGAGNRHGALANRLAWMQQAYGLGATDTVLQKTPFSFDVSVWEFFWPLTVGARLAVAEPGAHRDPAALAAHIQRHGVTTLHFVPSMLQAFVAEESAGACTGIKRIVCSGEALPAALQDRVLERWPEVGLYNLYGPTEAAIDVTHWTCRAGDAEVPIGRPIGNVQTYVLDREMNLLPQGVRGELYLGGAGLGRGYEQRPGLTAERFVPDPYSEEGGRLYRTGDLARWNGEDQLEYQGRIDHQVKIRGFRIELGEVESQLQRQSGVREAVVTAQDGPSGARLVGYAAAQPGQTLDGQQLRARLSEALPEYMVPSAILVLEALPLTPNGKVDRKALPAPEFVSQGYEAPQGEVEETLARIWTEVLGVERVGRQDNFFELGGDSILSLQVVARMRQAGLKLTPRQVFEHPTVATLARMAQDLGEAPQYEEIHEAQDLTPIQASFFARFPQGLSHWNQSVLLAIPEGLELAGLARAIAALVAAHDALRLRFGRDEQGQWRQRVCPAEKSEVLSVCDLRSQPDWRTALEREATRLQGSLDIERGPLLRVGYFILEGEARLLLAIHHLAVDGVSWRVLLEELQHGYEQAIAGEAVRLPSNTPWSVWVQRQLAHAQTHAVSAEAGWWREALAGAEASPPEDEPSWPGESRSISVGLDEAETRQLLREAPRAYRTGVEDLLLAALSQTLGGWSGKGGVLVALEGHGREGLAGQEALDLDRTVGWFTTRYPVWLLAYDESRQAIVSTKERLRSVPSRGLHFGLLGDRLADLPRPRIGFNYLGQFDQSLSRSGRFRFAQESGGAAMAEGPSAELVLDLNGMIAGGRLSVRWSYRDGVMAEAEVRELAGAFLERVRALVRHCLEAAPGATASDFPLSRLTQRDLEGLELDLSDVEDIYPATPVQQGMLFHSLLQAGQGVYVNQKRLTLQGRLDREKLRLAWETVVSRHTVLRTHFELGHGGDALQVVHRSVSLPYEERDWADLGQDDYEAKLQSWLHADVARGFEVGRAPLLRLALFTRPDGQHDLVWTDHHVVMDGWSTGQLMGEVMHVYGALANGTPMALPGGTRYRDYIEWLQAQPDAQSWWRDVASRYDDPATLLESLGRLKTDATGSGQIRDSLGSEAGAALRAAAQTYRVTLNTLVQAAWAALLSRYGNRRNVAFGITVSGRPAELPGAQTMLGLFINTLPVWFNVPGDAPLGAWLGALQDYNSQLRQYEHASLAEVQQWLGRSGDALFDSLLVFESYPVDEKIREGEYEVGISGFEAAERTHYPLAIAVVPNDAVSIRWKWDRSRIPDDIAGRLLVEFKSMLTQIVRPGLAHVGDMNSNAPSSNDPLLVHPFRPVAARIAERVRTAGNGRAVSCDGIDLSYADLDAWSNRIARRLLRLGAGAESRVGICMVRSPGLIAALLGVMKSGAAFVPLDPDYPLSRLRDMMDDAGIRWLVTDTESRGRHVDLMADARLVLANEVDSEPAEDCNVAIQPGQLAYVIYTSGSTGKPKGVAISHDALSQHMDDFLATYRITDADRQLQSSTINFDVALHEMLPALMQGGQVVMRGPSPWDLDTINRRLMDERVTFARIPTAYWQQWLRESPPPSELSLRQITVGGEALPGDALGQWRRGPLSHIRLDNLYGPTETTVACMYRQTRAEDVQHVAVPIGRPYPSRSVYVLDLDGAEAPLGGLGELCIGGATLARGYLERPGLTAERFVPDPFGASGARLYRTGDLCRRQADGTIEFLGRIDQQVKLRGFRIELGEIEMALRAVPGVRDAAAELRGDGEDRHLVGYFVGDADQDRVHKELAAVLPQYMVPSALVALAALPVLPSGKLDRKALPDAGAARTARQAMGPGTQMEAKLLSIWREVLQRDDVGVTDNFLDMGGDSLKALTVASLAARHRIAEFSLESLFSHPTVVGLAAHLDAKSPRMPSNIFPLNAPTGCYNLFAVHPGYGLVAEYRPLAKRIEGIANVYGIQSPLYTEPEWWPSTLVDVARDYVERIRGVQPSGPYHLIGWSSGGWIAREMAIVLEAMGEEVAFIGMVDSAPRDAQAMGAITGQVEGRGDADPHTVTQAEVEALLKTVQDDAGRWKQIVPVGEAGNAVLKTAILTGKHFSAVELSGHEGTQRSPLFLWTASESARQSSDVHADRWRSVSNGEVTFVKAIDTDHIRVIRDPAFLDSVFQTLSLLRSSPNA